MTELGEKEATARMLSLNSNTQKRKSAKWRRPFLPALQPPEALVYKVGLSPMEAASTSPADIGSA